MNTRHIPIRSLPIQTDAMRLDQIQSHAIITQALNVQRLQREARTSRNPLVQRDRDTAQDILDDLLDRVAGRYRSDPPPQEEWPPLPMGNIITNGGDYE